MPTSRKRAKGKERKLKQQARQSVSSSSPPLAVGGDMISLPEQNIQRVERAKRNIRCVHGGFKLPRGHPARDFIDLFINPNLSIKEFMEISFVKHQEVWKDGAMRKMVIDGMVSIGTDLIIWEFIEDARTKSEAIIVFENYDGEDTLDSALSKALEDIGYLLNAEDRDTVHFYKKRIPCSCLDELYFEIKKCQDRGSQCHYCKQTVKRKDLKMCNRCKYAQYCSKECQTLAWPSHKENCIAVANIHERVNKAEAARSNEGI